MKEGRETVKMFEHLWLRNLFLGGINLLLSRSHSLTNTLFNNCPKRYCSNQRSLSCTCKDLLLADVNLQRNCHVKAGTQPSVLLKGKVSLGKQLHAASCYCLVFWFLSSPGTLLCPSQRSARTTVRLGQISPVVTATNWQIFKFRVFSVGTQDGK